MKKQKTAILNIGTCSILVIFVLLCLVTFATLSLVSANADYQLSKKNADRVKDYYEADTEAEELLGEIDACLYNLCQKERFSSEEDFLAAAPAALREFQQITVSEGEASFSMPLGEEQILYVKLTLEFPKKPGDGFYKLTHWQVMNTGSWEGDNSLPVYLPNVEGEFES